MADFETKLRWLSERGNPVGAEELIELIEAELAGDPLVVPAKRREGTTLTKTQQSPPTYQWNRYRGPAWAVAAFVAVLAVAGIFLALSGDSEQGEVADTPPPPTTPAPAETMTDLEIIGSGVDALYSGEVERAVELFELQDGDDDQIRQEAAYQAAIGGRLTLNCTEVLVLAPGGELLNTPGVFTCNVPYHNAITDAVGYVDSPGDTNRVVVSDGVITEFAIPEHGFLLNEVGIFLEEQVEGYEGCVDDLRTPECASLIVDHLDEWAAWCGQIVHHEFLASSCQNRS
jgi:hypothetical protein